MHVYLVYIPDNTPAYVYSYPSGSGPQAIVITTNHLLTNKSGIAIATPLGHGLYCLSDFPGKDQMEEVQL